MAKVAKVAKKRFHSSKSSGDMNARDYDGDYAGRGNDRFNTGRLYDGDYAGPLNVARKQEAGT